jgi:hypothetical protein
MKSLSALNTHPHRRKRGGKKHNHEPEGGLVVLAPLLPKTKVDELLERTLSNVSSLETIHVSTDRMKSVLERGDDVGYSSGDDFNSPRRRGFLSDRSGYSEVGSSQWETNSFGTDWTLSSRMPTNRELLHQIERCAKRGKARPDYVTSLSDLDPSLISWNRRIPKLKKDDPPVNIIGCMHPLELVLAKADQRMRKQTHAVHLKQIKCEERTKAVDDAIKWKFSRAERYAAALARKQLQYQWLRIIQACRYFAVLSPRFRGSFHVELEFLRVSRLTMILHRFLLCWYRKHTFAKFQVLYREAFAKIEKTLKRCIRHVRKVRAANRVRIFLLDHKGHHKV